MHYFLQGCYGGIPLVGNAAHVNVAFYEPECTGTFVLRSGLL